MDETAFVKRDWYPNGQVKEETFYNDSQIANGWSHKTYYINGQLQQQQCYSQGQLIEQQTFDEQGRKIVHTIWNHRLQQMVDRPIVVPASKTARPNIASGCLTINRIAEILPLAAELIDAPDQSAELVEAHDAYYGYSIDEDDNEWIEQSDETEYWRLDGKKGSFTVAFERHEGYLFYHIQTPDIIDYEKARQLVDRAQKRNRVSRYYSEESALENAAKTEKPILHYIAPYRNKTCLEWELATWGTEPIYSLLTNYFIFYITRIEQTNENRPQETTFLKSLPDGENIITNARQGHVFYIIQSASHRIAPIACNPSSKELEDFLVMHQRQ
jgi:hypothetical protein